MKKILRYQKQWHTIIAFLLLPLLNLSALFYIDIFTQNQSYIGNDLHHPFYLFLWGSCSALYFRSMTHACLKKYPCLPMCVNLLLTLFCGCMILSVLFPYDPQANVWISLWHVRLAMFGSGGYAFFVFCFLFYASLCGYQNLRRYLFIYVILCFISSYSFAMQGAVTSFTEITYSIGMGIFLYYLRYSS